MEDCIFCKIVKGEIPASKIYEDEEFFAFLDINPVTKGHSLIIPKQHFEMMDNTPDDVIERIFLLAKKFMMKMKENFDCDYINLDIEGIQVPHFHIHLIPRLNNDDVVEWKHTKYESQDELENFINKIK